MNLKITISFAMVLLALVSFGYSSPIGETMPESETTDTDMCKYSDWLVRR